MINRKDYNTINGWKPYKGNWVKDWKEVKKRDCGCKQAISLGYWNERYVEFPFCSKQAFKQIMDWAFRQRKQGLQLEINYYKIT